MKIYIVFHVLSFPGSICLRYCRNIFLMEDVSVVHPSYLHDSRDKSHQLTVNVRWFAGFQRHWNNTVKRLSLFGGWQHYEYKDTLYRVPKSWNTSHGQPLKGTQYTVRYTVGTVSTGTQIAHAVLNYYLINLR